MVGFSLAAQLKTNVGNGQQVGRKRLPHLVNRNPAFVNLELFATTLRKLDQEVKVGFFSFGYCQAFDSDEATHDLFAIWEPGWKDGNLDRVVLKLENVVSWLEKFLQNSEFVHVVVRSSKRSFKRGVTGFQAQVVGLETKRQNQLNLLFQVLVKV